MTEPAARPAAGPEAGPNPDPARTAPVAPEGARNAARSAAASAPSGPPQQQAQIPARTPARAPAHNPADSRARISARIPAGAPPAEPGAIPAPPRGPDRAPAPSAGPSPAPSSGPSAGASPGPSSGPAAPAQPPTGARLRILDAAEREFAERGYHGAAMRRIGEAAGVAPALVSYHFGDRDALFAAVVGRRVDAITAMRMRMLDAMPDPGLEELLYALFRPALDPDAGGADFGRILAGMAYGPEHLQRMTERLYHPTARRFIGAFRAALPGLSEERAVRGYLLCIGGMISVMASAGRGQRLMGREEEERALAGELGDAIAHAAGGLRALAEEEEREE